VAEGAFAELITQAKTGSIDARRQTTRVRGARWCAQANGLGHVEAGHRREGCDRDRAPAGRRLESVAAYWHVVEPSVSFGQIVYRGDVIGKVADLGGNSHLHWEIRTWSDGSNLFPPTSAGGRGTCNGRIPALGYTWDDLLARASPNAWGYLDPAKFVKARQHEQWAINNFNEHDNDDAEQANTNLQLLAQRPRAR
jgi:hypothetical protein